jgi:ATP-binding cassette subfamily B protein
MTTARSIFARALWSNPGPVLALGVVLALAMPLEAAPALLVRAAVDRALHLEPGGGLWGLASLYLLAVTAQRSLAFGQGYLTTLVGQDILHRLRQSLATHLGLLPVRYYDNVPVGDTMSRLTADVDAVNTLFASGVVNLVADFLKLAGALAAMLALSRRLTLVAWCAIPVVLVMTEYFRRNIRRAEREIRQAVSGINVHYQESLTGIRVIHAYGLQESSLRQLSVHTDRFLAAINRSGRYTAYFGPLTDVLRGLCSVAVVLLFLAEWGRDPGLTPGTLVAFLQLTARLFGPLTALSDDFQVVQQALAGAERVDELLAVAPEARPEAVELPGAPSGRVEVRDLVFGYQEGQAVVEGVTVSIAPGESVAIVGRTGAGKTSLLGLLSGIYAPWSGEVTIDGIDPRGLAAADRRRLLGVVPQVSQVFDGSIAENIALGDPRVSRSQVEEVLSLVGLDGPVARLPQGLDTPTGPGGIRLSQGEEQLLSLARALVCRPPVLLLDEPTAGVDAGTERRLFAALAKEGGSRTIITVSHRLSGVLGAQRVLVMAGGAMVQDGSPEELAREDGWYATMKSLEESRWSG